MDPGGWLGVAQPLPGRHVRTANDTAPVSSAERREQRQCRKFLPEIQALRAVAVGLVVAFHLWPSGLLRGGFVGVDAFFVISGYLITAHLVREATKTGTVRLRTFYARRMRRLLPASIVTLVVSAVLVFIFLPLNAWRSAAGELVASAFYIQNLWLANQAVTYSASNDLASPVQHFWSLSAEEQFYLVWPALIILGFWWARRRRIRPSRLMEWRVTAILAAVVVASLTFSWWFTEANGAAAYFVTPTRAWEFGLGALCVPLLQRWVPGPAVAVVLRWLGLVAILGAAVTFSQATPFPGWLASIPVVGTAAVIVAGEVSRPDPTFWLSNNAVTQWLGNISYSVYLWHWPLIVVAPYVVGRELNGWLKLAIIALTLVVAHVSRKYVEDVTRLMPQVRRSSWRTFVVALSGMLVVTTLAGGLVVAQSYREQQILNAAQSGVCTGAGAASHRDVCPDAFTAVAVSPIIPADAPWLPDPACVDLGTADRHLICDFSGSTKAKVVAAVGDSHVEAYAAPLYAIAKERHWVFHVMVTQGCSPNYTATVSLAGVPRDPALCPKKSHEVTDQIRALEPDLILTSGFASRLVFDPPDKGADGYRMVFADWTAVAPVIVINDAPTVGIPLADCLAKAGADVQRCSRPRSKADTPTALSEAALSMVGDRLSFIPVADNFCDAKRCYGVVGGLPVYYDWDHLNRRFAMTLLPYLREQIKG